MPAGATTSELKKVSPSFLERFLHISEALRLKSAMQVAETSNGESLNTGRHPFSISPLLAYISLNELDSKLSNSSLKATSDEFNALLGRLFIYLYHSADYSAATLLYEIIKKNQPDCFYIDDYITKGGIKTVDGNNITLVNSQLLVDEGHKKEFHALGKVYLGYDLLSMSPVYSVISAERVKPALRDKEQPQLKEQKEEKPTAAARTSAITSFIEGVNRSLSIKPVKPVSNEEQPPLKEQKAEKSKTGAESTTSADLYFRKFFGIQDNKPITMDAIIGTLLNKDPGGLLSLERLSELLNSNYRFNLLVPGVLAPESKTCWLSWNTEAREKFKNEGEITFSTENCRCEIMSSPPSEVQKKEIRTGTLLIFQYDAESKTWITYGNLERSKGNKLADNKVPAFLTSLVSGNRLTKTGVITDKDARIEMFNAARATRDSSLGKTYVIDANGDIFSKLDQIVAYRFFDLIQLIMYTVSTSPQNTEQEKLLYAWLGRALDLLEQNIKSSDNKLLDILEQNLKSSDNELRKAHDSVVSQLEQFKAYVLSTSHTLLESFSEPQALAEAEKTQKEARQEKFVVQPLIKSIRDIAKIKSLTRHIPTIAEVSATVSNAQCSLSIAERFDSEYSSSSMRNGLGARGRMQYFFQTLKNFALITDSGFCLNEKVQRLQVELREDYRRACANGMYFSDGKLRHRYQTDIDRTLEHGHNRGHNRDFMGVLAETFVTRDKISFQGEQDKLHYEPDIFLVGLKNFVQVEHSMDLKIQGFKDFAQSLLDLFSSISQPSIFFKDAQFIFRDMGLMNGIGEIDPVFCEKLYIILSNEDKYPLNVKHDDPDAWSGYIVEEILIDCLKLMVQEELAKEQPNATKVSKYKHFINQMTDYPSPEMTYSSEETKTTLVIKAPSLSTSTATSKKRAVLHSSSVPQVDFSSISSTKQSATGNDDKDDDLSNDWTVMDSWTTVGSEHPVTQQIEDIMSKFIDNSVRYIQEYYRSESVESLLNFLFEEGAVTHWEYELDNGGMVDFPVRQERFISSEAFENERTFNAFQSLLHKKYANGSLEAEIRRRLTPHNIGISIELQGYLKAQVQTMRKKYNSTFTANAFAKMINALGSHITVTNVQNGFESLLKEEGIADNENRKAIINEFKKDFELSYCQSQSEMKSTASLGSAKTTLFSPASTKSKTVEGPAPQTEVRETNKPRSSR